MKNRITEKSSVKQYNCSIIGLGRIGSLLEDDALREKPASHAGAIAVNPRCTLISGCDIDREKQSRFKKRWDCPALFSDIDELIAYRVPDILCIATPPETHHDLVLKAVKSSVPLVICEKPLTEDLRQAEQIAESVSASESILMVNHERRYSKDYLHLKEIIGEKKYGRLCSIAGKLFMGRGATVKEMLWEDGTHMIDIIRFLTGQEAGDIRVAGDLSEKGGECMILFRFGSIPVVIDAACSRDHLVFELDVSFEKGLVRIGNGVFEEYESGPSPFYERIRSLGKKPGIGFDRTNYFSGMLEDAVRTLDNRKKKHDPVSKGIDGVQAVRVISEIIAEAEKNRLFDVP